MQIKCSFCKKTYIRNIFIFESLDITLSTLHICTFGQNGWASLYLDYLNDSRWYFSTRLLTKESLTKWLYGYKTNDMPTFVVNSSQMCVHYLYFNKENCLQPYLFSLFHTLVIIKNMATKIIQTEVLKIIIIIIRLLTAKNIITYRASVIKMCLSVVYDILVIVQTKSKNVF